MNASFCFEYVCRNILQFLSFSVCLAQYLSRVSSLQPNDLHGLNGLLGTFHPLPQSFHFILDGQILFINPFMTLSYIRLMLTNLIVHICDDMLMFAMRCEVTLLNAIRKLCYLWLHIIIFIAVGTVDLHLSSLLLSLSFGIEYQGTSHNKNQLILFD